MRIALTGSSSVGKTFLSNHLMKNKKFRSYISHFITPDARSILDKMGHGHTDVMSRDSLREFQIAYFKRKQQIEHNQYNFLTERSFIDVEAFWRVRDTFDMPPSMQNKLTEKCYYHAQKYDLHIYLPFGIVPFQSDGYRSEDIEFHYKVDHKIQDLLQTWKLRYITLDRLDIEHRVNKVINQLSSLKG